VDRLSLAAKVADQWPGTPVAKPDPNPPPAGFVVDPKPAFNPDEFLASAANEDIKLAIRATVIGVAATGAASGAMLVFFAGLGWIIAGFARD
jgi:hypothetical protein